MKLRKTLKKIKFGSVDQGKGARHSYAVYRKKIASFDLDSIVVAVCVWRRKCFEKWDGFTTS